jgi:hypothetical protein
MCPMCLETMIANIGWIAAGVTSIGGISALAMSKFRVAKREPGKEHVTEGGTNGDE